jgi:hypothetical protein
MKTLLLFLIAVTITVATQAQTSVRMNSEPIGFWTLNMDTMQITKLDKVVKGSVYAPSFATDSVKISGCTFTIDGIATNGITIPPGEASFGFGFDYAYSDTVKIIAKNKAWVLLLIKR